MNRRLFFAPWGPERLPASYLERHCAKCRALELPYETPPQAVASALREVSEETKAAVGAQVQKAVSNIEKMFEWTPEAALTPQGQAPQTGGQGQAPKTRDPIEVLRSGVTTWDHYGLWGGRGSGKSHSAADAVIELASTRKERVAGAREHMNRIKESSKEVLEQKVKDSPWADDWEMLEYELRNKRTGSVIFFVGLSGGSAGPDGVAKALEGITLLWTDEAQLVTQRSLDIILPTVRASGSRCLWTWNPGEDPSPIDQLFRGDHPPERSLISCRLVEDNPHLYRTRLAAEMRSGFARDSEDKFRHIWRGAHLEISDTAVFNDIVRGYLDFDALTGRVGDGTIVPLGGMDFGYGGADPSAAVRAYLIQPRAQPGYVPEAGFKPILYVSAEAVERSVPNHQLWELMKAAGLQSVICDSAMPLMISALNASGYGSARPALKGAGSLLAGIRKMQSCTILIAPSCPVAYEEIRGLRWKVDPKTNKIKRPLETVGEDHCIAALRYALSETEITNDDGVTHV